jgi:hypothetical protein
MEGMGQPHQVRNQQPQPDSMGGQQQPVQPEAPQEGNGGNGWKWYHPTPASKTAVILVVLAAIVVLGSFIAGLFAQSNGVADMVKKDQHQAVFLSNNQVYFGDITGFSDDTLVLENVYYLQVDQQLQPETEDQRRAAAQEPQISLAKLGNELHGPEDQMFISIDKVVFWENLQEEGQVSQAIKQHQEADNKGETEANNNRGQQVPTQDTGLDTESEGESDTETTTPSE